MGNLYTSGDYNIINTTYHEEDSSFKAKNFINILKKNNFDSKKIKTIVDVGCGAGEILKILEKIKIFDGKFIGYDINPEAIKIAEKKKNISLEFICGDFLTLNSKNISDLIICADVYEHIENYIDFLKKLNDKSNYFLFNIPLDISFRSLLNKKIITENFNKVGHLHFFNKQIALLVLDYCGFKIIDSIYAKNYLEHSNKNTIKKKIFSLPVRLVDTINEDLSATIFGGYSLVVLAQSKNYL